MTQFTDPASNTDISTALSNTAQSNTQTDLNLAWNTNTITSYSTWYAGYLYLYPYRASTTTDQLTINVNGTYLTYAPTTFYGYSTSSYSQAVADAYDEALKEAVEEAVEQAYDIGYDDGYEDGFDDGFEAGWGAAEDHHGIN